MDSTNRSLKTNLTMPSKTTTQSNAESQPPHSRENFLRDLKKVVKKLPPDHPSRSDPRKR